MARTDEQHHKKSEQYVKKQLEKLDSGGKRKKESVVETEPVVQKRRTSELCLASFLLGIFGLVLPPFAILAIIFGIAGLMQARRQNLRGKWMGIFGIIFGFIGLVAFAVLLVVALNFVESFVSEVGPLLSGFR